jgi:3-methyladenine DNA glycosylase/8-oxoguanine DNA glycosylase
LLKLAELVVQELPDAAAMGRISERWRPFRSVGCYYMWRVEVPRTVGRSKGKGNKQAAATSKSRAPL